MLGLPKSAEMSKQLPKKAIYAKFNMNTVAKEKFDADISRISIVAEISPKTVNIESGEAVASIFVLLVSLKRRDYDEKTIVQLSKLIEQNMLLVLEYEGECRLAIYHTKLIQGEWQSTDTCSVMVKGLNLDAVWENIVVQVGGIEIEGEHSLDEQIEVDEQKAKLMKEIARIEKLAKKEKQPKKKFDFVEQVKILKKRIGEL